MSLINQVLKDLDKRGANPNVGEASIRVVHAHGRHSAVLLVAAGAAGMLGVGAAASMIWQAQQRISVPAPAIVVTPRPVETLPASQPVAAPVPLIAQAVVQAMVPRIDSVSPAEIMATGMLQTITLNGSNFKEGASVTLRRQDGQTYADHPIASLTPTQIVLKLKFKKIPNAWTVEVLNSDGTSSGQYEFMVQAPAAAVRPAKQAAAATPTVGPGRMVSSPPAAVPAGTQPGVLAMGGVNKQPTQISLQQQADNEFRRAYQLMRQGSNSEALAGYENALKLDPGHDLARQSMVSLLLGKKRNADAENVLQEGLLHNPQQATFAMLLARLQVERNAVPLALETLQHALPYAGKQPDYLAFVAALLQRQHRHKDAVDYFRKALQLSPQSGVWLMGLGISLRAEQHNDDARDAFRRALESHNLSTELQSFVTQQLKEL